VADVVPYLKKIMAKFDDPVLQGQMAGFSKSIQLVFPDLNETYVLTVLNGKTVTIERKSLETPDLVITWNSDVFAGIEDKSVDPTTAFMSGKLKVKGAMDDLLKLQKFMV
jgi:putative sterol carrier protein